MSTDVEGRSPPQESEKITERKKRSCGAILSLHNSYKQFCNQYILLYGKYIYMCACMYTYMYISVNKKMISVSSFVDQALEDQFKTGIHFNIQYLQNSQLLKGNKRGKQFNKGKRHISSQELLVKQRNLKLKENSPNLVPTRTIGTDGA